MTLNFPFKYDSIFIIEVLRSRDTKTGSILYELLKSDLHGYGFRAAEIRQPASLSEFFEALEDACNFAVRGGHSPILHIEAHGSPDSIDTSPLGDSVSWEELYHPLVKLNAITRFNLIVVTNVCHGLYLADSSLILTRPAPAYAILGPRKQVDAGDLGYFNEEFYRNLVSAPNLNEALAAGLWKEIGLQLIPAELQYCKVFDLFIKTYGTSGRLEIDSKVQNNLKTQGQLAPWTEGFLKNPANHELIYLKYRRRFLMLDRFPENEARFRLDFASCREVFKD
jgi:hypothetical protein